MTPARRATILYLVHAYASARGWDVTTPELARHLGEKGIAVIPTSVSNICRDWMHRVRHLGDNRQSTTRVFDTWASGIETAANIRRHHAEVEE